jgi:prepilin-type N-terminal cleavage/methylation domain-containing protein
MIKIITYKQGKRPDRHHRRAGLSLIEVLLSITIMAMLLTATAVAFDAAFKSYKVNHDLATVSVSARNALFQMNATIRSAYNDPDWDTIDISADGTECSLVDQYGNTITYRYYTDNKQLKVEKIDEYGHSSGWCVMVDNVYPVTVGDWIFSGTRVNGNYFGNITNEKLYQVEIRFMVVQEGLSRTISSATVPANILYE